MGRDQRLAELEVLRAEGKLSETEYQVLVEVANKEEDSTNNTTFDHVPPLKSGNADSSAQNRSRLLQLLVIAAAIVVVLVVGAVAFRTGDPTDSVDYKNLLSEKEFFETNIRAFSQEVEGYRQQLAEYAEVESELNDYKASVERWREFMSELKAIK